MSSPSEIVNLLKEASDAYYNGRPLKMDDATFDALLDRLREIDPTNPYLTTIGAPPSGTAVKLPYPMPSLDKIKPGQDALKRFLSLPGSSFVITEKLDGLSALWIPSKGRGALYLRGDGSEGQDISHLIPLGIQGLHRPFNTCAIRGELVVARTQVATLARSWVNGIIHQSSPSKEDVQRIRFVAYDLFKPDSLTRYQQFTWLRSQGFEIPWISVMKTVGENDLATYLQTRRKESPYDTDGIVVSYDTIPVRANDAKNPKDSVAFKMPLADQSAQTTIRAVHWGASSQGYLIPKLEFDPVTIGAASIQFCSAHNAKNIETQGLGPGATIIVRRSGDVIPTLDSVLKKVTPSFPPKESYEWINDVHIRSKTVSTEVIKAKLHHFLRSLDIPGSGPATAAALVDGGIQRPSQLLAATADQLSQLTGPKTGAALYKNIRSALEKASEAGIMVASSIMPRGVGETKLSALFEKEKDPRLWTPSLSVTSWTATSLQNFLNELPKYIAWRTTELPEIPFPKGVVIRPSVPSGSGSGSGQVVCMTGFRNKELEATLISRGHTISPTLTSKVTVLLVPDGERKESEKTKAATEKGVPILTVSEFKTKYLL